MGTMMFEMTDLQYQAVYNTLSFSLASMSSTTMYLWFRASAVADKYKSAVYISGLVTFIAAYHYIRIFNSWVDAYSYEGVPNGERPKMTGVPFNDAYRYMDWLLTVPLLLIEILLVMKLEGDNFSSKAWTLGFGSALMIVSGYYGELVVTGDLTPRWVGWFLSMGFFLYIVYELLVGLAAATASDAGDQLVHVPSCLLVPNVRLFGSESNRVHPGRLLRQRHYFQVRSWLGYLSDLLRQVWKESSLAISSELGLSFDVRRIGMIGTFMLLPIIFKSS